MRVAVQSDPIQKAFAGSVLTHGVLIGLVVFSGLLHLSTNFGEKAASTGSVGVTMVKTIPMPRRDAPPNPLANDSESKIPEAPAPTKLRTQVIEAPKNAIPIPEKILKKKKPSPAPQSSNPFRPPADYKPNQIASHIPQAASSPLYGMKGSNGIDVGQASVLGYRFGAYVDLMRDRISQHWMRADVRATPQQKCVVSFTIARDGTVADVRISQPSGNYLLDNSAKRAVMDSSPLPALPRDYTGNQAAVDLGFQMPQ